MAESSVSSVPTANTSYSEAYPQSNTKNNRQQRKKQNRSMQNSSQDVRYNHQAYQQQYPQAWDPYYANYDDYSYYYQQPNPRGSYRSRNNHQHQQQRRPQSRQSATSTQVNHQQVNTRTNTTSSTRTTNETENLRSDLTEQLFDNTYECMICIIKIEYVSPFHSSQFICFLLIRLDEIKKSGHAVFAIKCFIYSAFANGLIVKKVVQIRIGVVLVVNIPIRSIRNTLAFVINEIIHHFNPERFLIRAENHVTND